MPAGVIFCFPGLFDVPKILSYAIFTFSSLAFDEDTTSQTCLALPCYIDFDYSFVNSLCKVLSLACYMDLQLKKKR